MKTKTSTMAVPNICHRWQSRNAAAARGSVESASRLPAWERGRPVEWFPRTWEVKA